MLVQNSKGDFFNIPDKEINKYRIEKSQLSKLDLQDVDGGKTYWLPYDLPS